MKLDLKKELRAYGAAASEVRILDDEKYELINYLDLIKPKKEKNEKPQNVLPDAVVETDNLPLIYVVRADSLAIKPEQKKNQLATLL